MHRNSLLLFDRYARSLIQPGHSVLEIGGSLSGSLFKRLCADIPSWQTLDLFSSPDVTWTAKSEYEFPCESNTFDIIFSAQVIEHVKKPWRWLPELQRVCKPGGHVITINPVNWPYHEAPVDCWRIYPEGMKALYEDAALEVLLCKTESLELSTLKFFTLHGSYTYALREGLRRLKAVDRPFVRAFDTITIGRKI
jgi:SAM-dependent methyltransferase